MCSKFLNQNFENCSENPLVCTQDGFHVMNGREAINLTTEANLICKTDYANDVTDQCPRKAETPIRKGCCEGKLGQNWVQVEYPKFQPEHLKEFQRPQTLLL